MALINQVAPRMRTWHQKAHISMTACRFFLFAQPLVIGRKCATGRIQAGLPRICITKTNMSGAISVASRWSECKQRGPKLVKDQFHALQHCCQAR